MRRPKRWRIVERDDDSGAARGAIFTPIEPPAPGPVEDSTPVAPEIPDSTFHAGRDLAHSLTTLTACADMLGSAASISRARGRRQPDSRGSVAASSLLLATRALRQELKVRPKWPCRRRHSDRVARGFDAERRIRHIAIELSFDPSAVPASRRTSIC